MDSCLLFERAKFRRKLAALAISRIAAKKEMTPQEIKEALEKPTKLQSIFGAPKDSSGKSVGKAGRTIALMEKWLKQKGKYGLPPVGDQFKVFVTQELDGSNYIWGHEEAVRDLSRDIHYNFGFDPDQVSVVEAKETEESLTVQPKAETEEAKQANMGQLPPMVKPLQGPLNMASVKKFTREAQFAYQMSEADDYTVLPETPVVTRVDYYESIEKNGDLEKAKEKSEFGKEPAWTFNDRQVGKNDLLEDLDADEYEKEEPAVGLLEKEQLDDYDKPDSLYPVRGFVKKQPIKGFAQKKIIKSFTQKKK